MYKPTIGLEIHCQLNTKSKMFCSCPNNPEKEEPNRFICPVCLGHPGTLPTINREAVVKIIKAGKALNCSIADYSLFDRKNYFYPDLPKGYQISQHKHPFCYDGYLEVEGRKISIERIHLEEDTGSLIHKDKSALIDFNRSSTPLMELVTQPEIRSGKEAAQFARELRLIFRYLEISSADMEKGQMRVEVNISLSQTKKMGTKVEIKNLNSFKAVEQAVEYEIKRQEKRLKEGKEIVQETRGWDDEKKITASQRVKEEAHDYRYFPEPDLPPLDLLNGSIKKEEISLERELPQERRKRLEEDYNLKDFEILITDISLGDYFDLVMENLPSKEKVAKLAFNYISSDLQGMIESSDKIGIPPKDFSKLIELIDKGDISSKIAKKVLKEMFDSGKDPETIIDEKGLKQLTDEKELKGIISEVLKEEKEAVEDLKEGKEKAVQFLVGKVMAKTKGKADPQKVNQVIRGEFSFTKD